MQLTSKHQHRKTLRSLCADLPLTVTVTVTEALVLRPLLEDRGAHHRVNPYPGACKQNQTECFHIVTK